MVDAMRRWSLSRLLSLVRTAAPSALYLPPFLCGQVLALLALLSGREVVQIVGWSAATAGVVAAACLARRGTSFLRAQLLALGCGFVSAATAFPHRAPPFPSTSYLAEVIAEPRRRESGAVEFALRVAPLKGVRSPAAVLCKAADLPWNNASRLDQGERFIFRGRFRRAGGGLNPFTFDAGLFRRGYAATCKISLASAAIGGAPPALAKLKHEIVRRVNDVLGDGEEAGLLLSMSIGVRDMLSDTTEQAFRDAGLMQLLVVSGYQVSLVYHAARFLLRRVMFFLPWMRRGARGYYALALLPLLPTGLFVATVGLEGSSVRAGLAAVLLALTFALERRGGLFNGICGSLLLLSTLWPACILDPGIQLTYAALGGIWLGTLGGGGRVAIFIRVSLWATLLPSIVGLAWFGNFSLIGFILNPLVGLPASALACDGGIALLLLLYAGVPGVEIAVRLLAELLTAFRDLVLYAAELPGAAMHLEGGLRWCAVMMLTAAAMVIACRSIGRVITPSVRGRRVIT